LVHTTGVGHVSQIDTGAGIFINSLDKLRMLTREETLPSDKVLSIHLGIPMKWGIPTGLTRWSVIHAGPLPNPTLFANGK
jgi:hypothetical protein